ncbi:O-methylsterigmatocystin oxidoreductase [Coprinopsis sp. MPI-PUGE-AT-0042]|nr:O-methylsterigmatocystin oxidoreductase [Coprinopsis sp. MPI-PUGE-AT-0042]
MSSLSGFDVFNLALVNLRGLSKLSSISVVFPLLAILLARLYGTKRLNAPKPPGPKGLPFLGNLLQMPNPSGKTAPWRVFSQWREKYGDLVYLEAAGQKFLVLNSLSAIDELLNKRATNYSDRLSSPINTLTRHTWDFVMLNYTSQWRDHRRAFHQFFNQNHVQRVLRPVIDQEIAKLLKFFIEKPDKHEEALRLFFGTIIIRLSYGTGSSEMDRTRQLIKGADELVKEQALAFQPGRYLVAFMSWLQHVPSWFPGTGWKQRLEHLACLNDRLVEEPFETLKAQLRTEVQSDGLESTPNIATHLIDTLPEAGGEEYEYRNMIAKHVSAIAYLAGADTTLSSALALLLALAMHPEVQRKAQACIDTELGDEAGSRLPTWGDLERLPYISAVVKEVGRWHSVLPITVPHVSTDDDIYQGSHIPAGTAILANTWAVMHDPATFDDPFEFKPERYLTNDGKINPNILGPEDGAFGYGRRWVYQ